MYFYLIWEVSHIHKCLSNGLYYIDLFKKKIGNVFPFPYVKCSES